MKIAPAILGLLAAGAGFVSVYYWWKSARVGTVRIPEGMTPSGADGDVWINYGGKETVLLNFSGQSKLNALAALWTGVSVFLQTVSIIVTLCIAKPV